MMDFGKHIILCLSGTQITSEERALLARLRPIGFNIRAQNLNQQGDYADWIGTFAELVDDLSNVIGRDTLLLGIDHEGGRVNRLPKPIVRFPYPLVFREKSAEVGAAMAEQLRSVGFNFCFGPVADIHTCPDNPVIGPRCFGTKSEEVIEAVLPFFHAMSQGGMRLCAKHFPGHGATREDTHFELPSLNLAREELFERELKPFKSLIDAGISCVMSSHILFPQIDSTFPATLSSILMKDILRGDLGFTGVSISDDLDMQAIRDNFPIVECARRTVEASVDLVIFNHFPKRAEEFCKALSDVVAQSREAENALIASEARIDKLISQLEKEGSPKMLDQEVLERHMRLLKSLPAGEEFDLVSHRFEPK